MKLGEGIIKNGDTNSNSGHGIFSRRKFLEACGVFAASLAMTACGGGGNNENSEQDNGEQSPEVIENSNAELEPIQIVNKGYNNIYIYSEGVDEDGIEHVDFYAIHNGKVACKVTKKYNGEVEFNENINLTGLDDNTVYEIRTVCYSVNGKTKSIEKNSVKTFEKTPNDPSNDTPDTTDTTDTPETPEVDNIAPTITLNGSSTITLTVGDTYIEQGANANDNVDGDLTNEIIIDNSSVDTSVAGIYTVIYTVSDSAGNETTISRTVEVEAPSTSWMTIPSGNSVRDLPNTPELVLSSVVDYINNYNLTDAISVKLDSRFKIQNGDLVYVGGNVNADQTVTLQLKVGDVLSNSFTVTILNTY